MKIAASTVWEILKKAGINHAPRRSVPAWPQFLRSQAEAILACDLLTADLLDGTQAYVLAVIEHATRRIRIPGITLHPAGEWTAQQARNLVMDLGEQAHRVKFMIRDRGSNYTAAFDAVLAGAGIRTVLCNVQTPGMNAIAERWIRGCRRELRAAASGSLERSPHHATALAVLASVLGPRAIKYHHRPPSFTCPRGLPPVSTPSTMPAP